MTTKRFNSLRWAGTAALSVSAVAAQALPTVGFDVASRNVNVGDSFVLVLQGSGFDLTAGGAAIDNLSGGQKLNLAYSAAALEITGIVIDPRWSFASANKPGTIDNAAGTLTGMSFGVYPGTEDDSFDIARIGFRALAAAAATVSVTAVDFVGKANNLAGTKIDATYLPSTVQISAVPEPQAWALLAAGLGLLAVRPRRV